MAEWAHLELEIDDDGNIEVSGYNADPSPLLNDAESWEEVVTRLGEDGWQLIQFNPDGDSTTYWFKKRVSL